MRPRSLALLLLLAAAPSSATASGFDFALERFAVSGGVSFVDEFDDGLRESGPTARLRDRMGTRVTESDGVLHLTAGDGAAPWVVPLAKAAARDWLALNLPIGAASGTTIIEGEFGSPVSAGTGSSFGIGAATNGGQPWETNGFLLTVEDVRAADYWYYAGAQAACFAHDGLVAMLRRGMEPDSFLWRPIHSCHPIDRAAISGPVVLRLSAYAVASGL